MVKQPVSADAVILVLAGWANGCPVGRHGYLQAIAFEEDNIGVCDCWLEARVFEDAKAAFDFINQVNPVHPIGENGLENRPAMRFRYTAISVTQMLQWETAGQTFH